mmetsp:Transcript_30092/g.64960  ORF Transcript_30092/g.64960 Transcript_30092/m.64960 type:complete len:123 (-) Transcript_30092:326-694(-)
MASARAESSYGGVTNLKSWRTILALEEELSQIFQKNVGSAEPTEEIRRDETAHDLLELAGVEPEPGSAQPAQLMPPPEVVSPHQRPHIMEFERGLSSPLENNDLRLELTLSLPQVLAVWCPV